AESLIRLPQVSTSCAASAGARQVSSSAGRATTAIDLAASTTAAPNPRSADLDATSPLQLLTAMTVMNDEGRMIWVRTEAPFSSRRSPASTPVDLLDQHLSTHTTRRRAPSCRGVGDFDGDRPWHAQ